MLRRDTLLFLLLLLGLGNAVAGTCVGDAQTLCLQGDRFMLKVDWRDEAGNDKTLGDTNAAGNGEKLKLNDETGFFRFFGPDHHEMMVKVLDGCGINDRFWVFVAAPTNV